MNKKMFVFRDLAKRSIRNMFFKEGFLEIDTPLILSTNAPDPYIDPLRVVRDDGCHQLRTSPEIWLKKALSLGQGKIYELGRVFRDDPSSPIHNIEFTMLEWYRAHDSLETLMVDCLNIFKKTCLAARESGFSALPEPESIEVKTVSELFFEHADIDLISILYRIAKGETDALVAELVKRKEYLPVDTSFSDAFFHIMIKYIEPKLPKNPIAITKWPLQLAALAEHSLENDLLCDRFEIYWQGIELCNAYQECVDKDELRSRFIKENMERKRLGKEQFIIDESFLQAMDHMPASAGIALGLDRLFQVVVQHKQITSVIFGC